MAIWDDVIPEGERWRYRGDVSKQRREWGKRPALLVIDVRPCFALEQPSTLTETVDSWIKYWGEEKWHLMTDLSRLIRTARESGIPVVYTEMRSDWNLRPARELAPGELTGERERTVADLLPQPQDLIIRKREPSAFFGTLLASSLIAMGIDTLIACGCMTSCCVRATLTDAAAYNFRVAIVEECTFDIRPTIHKTSMFEMSNYVGDVTNLENVSGWLMNQKNS